MQATAVGVLLGPRLHVGRVEEVDAEHYPALVELHRGAEPLDALERRLDFT